ncbi:hypothetical protein Hanom_Chr10g00916271 [Helianthus anomalus]
MHTCPNHSSTLHIIININNNSHNHILQQNPFHMIHDTRQFSKWIITRMGHTSMMLREWGFKMKNCRRTKKGERDSARVR